MVDAFDYLESRDDADELIAEFGAAASVRRTINSGSTFAPDQDVTDYPTFAVKVEFTWKQMQSGNVLETDERWLVAAGPLAALGLTTLQPGDAVVVATLPRKIVLDKPLSPAGVDVFYDCQCRT